MSLQPILPKPRACDAVNQMGKRPAPQSKDPRQTKFFKSETDYYETPYGAPESCPQVVLKVYKAHAAASSKTDAQTDVSDFFKHKFRYCAPAERKQALAELAALFNYFKMPVQSISISSRVLDLLQSYQTFLIERNALFAPRDVDVQIVVDAQANKFPLMITSELERLRLTILSVDVKLWKAVWNSIFRTQLLKKLTELTFENTHNQLALGAEHINYVENVRALRQFNIINFAIDDSFIEALSDSTFLQNLEALSFRQCRLVVGATFSALLSSCHLKNLKSLELPASSSDQSNNLMQSTTALLFTPYLDNLERLVVADNPDLLVAVARAVVGNPAIKNLKTLEFRGTAQFPYELYQSLKDAVHLQNLDISTFEI